MSPSEALEMLADCIRQTNRKYDIDDPPNVVEWSRTLAALLSRAVAAAE